MLARGASAAQVTPPALGNAARITVTELDDTVIVTGVVQGRALRNALTANGPTRPLFPDAPALLRGQAGRGPVVYLSNSLGGLTASLQTLLRESAAEHKTNVLDTLARTTAAQFTLIGDDGEHGPETYSRFARKHPGRVERLLIREGRPSRAAAGGGAAA